MRGTIVQIVRRRTRVKFDNAQCSCVLALETELKLNLFKFRQRLAGSCQSQAAVTSGRDNNQNVLHISRACYVLTAVLNGRKRHYERTISLSLSLYSLCVYRR